MFAKKVEILHGIDRWNATDNRKINGRDGVMVKITAEDGTVTTEEVSVDDLPKVETTPAPTPQPVLPGVDYSAPDKKKEGNGTINVGVA